MGKHRDDVPKRLRHTFDNMKQRCYNPKAKSYNYYGGRGIIICEEWLNDRNKFFDWSLNNGYENNLSIDRIEVNGNYEPDNCRWTDDFVQANNRTNNVFIEIDGISKTAFQWSRDTNIGAGLITSRVNGGLTAYEDIFASPFLEIEINNEVKTIPEWSEISGLSTGTIYGRYIAGWDNNDLLSEVLNTTKHIEINGEIHTVTEWAKISGLTREIILNRISYGWKIEDLLKPRTRERGINLIEINNEWHTKEDWCKIIGISPATFSRRIKNGLTGNNLLPQ